MPIPIAQTLFQQIFGSSLPTASLTKPTETSDQEGEDVVRRGPAISFQDVLTRQFLGPAILPKTIDTPSGKVFAPDDPIPAKPDILATYPEKEKEIKIISSPMLTGEPKGLMGLPIPETQDKLKGFEKPQDVDTSVLKNVPIDKSSLKTQDYLDEKIVDELLKLRGGKQKFEESMKESMAPMPASTKNKMEIILQEKLFNKYKLNEYPEGESPDTVSEERKQKLINTYNKNLEAISYITSAAYDAIPGPNKNTVFVVDNDGLPIAGAKIGKGDLLGNAAKEAIAIKEVGSINSNATNDLLKEVNARALANGKKYIVAEDITSQEAIDAFKAKGFEPASLKKYKQFEGKLIYRPSGGKRVKQKNYVKEVEGYEENTSNPVGSLVDKPLSDETY